MSQLWQQSHLRRFKAAACLLGLATAPLQASRISLDISSSCESDERPATCAIEVVNRGDEPAVAIGLHLRFDDADSIGRAARPTLAVGETWSQSFAVSTAERLRGRHPVLIQVDYHDANLYPFTALAHDYIVIGRQPPALLHAVVEPLEIDDHGTVEVRVRSLEALPLEITLELILPRELIGKDSKRYLLLEADGSTIEKFEISNFSALEGSTYRVYALATHNGLEDRYSLFVPGMVSVVPRGGLLAGHRRWLVLALVILTISVVTAQFLGRRKSGGQSPDLDTS